MLYRIFCTYFFCFPPEFEVKKIKGYFILYPNVLSYRAVEISCCCWDQSQGLFIYCCCDNTVVCLLLLMIHHCCVFSVTRPSRARRSWSAAPPSTSKSWQPSWPEEGGWVASLHSFILLLLHVSLIPMLCSPSVLVTMTWNIGKNAPNTAGTRVSL